MFYSKIFSLLCCLACSIALTYAQPTAMSFVAANTSKAANFDRVSTEKTGWYWLTGVDAQAIKNKINQGYRLHDLEIESTSPLRFTAAFVKNSGAYKSGFWWWYGQSSDQVKSHISNKKARIIDMEIYYVNGQKKYAVVMVPNTGANAKSWWYYSKISAAKLKEKLTANKARLIDLDTYKKDGKTYFSAVMVKKSGVDNKAWWYYYGLTADQVKQKIRQNGARLTDIEYDGSRFAVVMEKNPARWYYYYGVSMNRVNELKNEKNARIADVHPYRVNGKKRFAVILVGAKGTSSNSSGSAGSGSTPTPPSGAGELPPIPQHIKLGGNNSTRIVVDFSNIINGQPEITIPTWTLPDLPMHNNEVIFPDNFCGMRVIKADRFVWFNQQNQPVQQFPYNYMSENQTLNDLENGENYFLGGIEFTGPTGSCANSNEPWVFPTPFTQTGTNPQSNMKLIIELRGSSRVEFLNYNIKPQHRLDAHELFDDETLDAIIEMAKVDEFFYESSAEYFEDLCAEQPVFCTIPD